MGRCTDDRFGCVASFVWYRGKPNQHYGDKSPVGEMGGWWQGYLWAFINIIMDLSENSFHIHYQPMVIKYDDDDVVVVIVVNDYC